MLRLWALPSFDLVFLWPGFHISCKSKQSNSLTRITMRILFKSENRATISAGGLDEGFPERASRASAGPGGLFALPWSIAR